MTSVAAPIRKIARSPSFACNGMYFILLDLFSRSSDRLARQNRIREMVKQSKERPNISALSREFKVARRTIIRDLQELIRRGELKPEVYPEWENPTEE